MITKVGPNNAGYNDKMKDKSIALDAAETSAEQKLDSIRAKKAQWLKQQQKEETKTPNSKEMPHPKASPAQASSEDMMTTPGRKARKPELTAEDLEYLERSETASWDQVTASAGSPGDNA